MNGRSATERILDAYLAPEADRLSDRVIDAALADIDRTPQRRALGVPWRFPHMPALSRASSIAMLALLAVAGVGGALYLIGSNEPGPVTPTPVPTAAPTATPGPWASRTGINGWTTYTSTIYARMSFGYPEEWSVRAPATRTWQVGDTFPADDMPFADTFVSPGEGDEQIGLIVWEMPQDAPPDTFEGLKVWAETFCNDVLELTSCANFTQQAVPMCSLLDDGCDAGDGAILVPTAGPQYAFFRTWQSELFDSSTVRVVVIGREDSFPTAVRYGGSVALLKSILTTMDVWTPGQPSS
jgi:hypothetical protein